MATEHDEGAHERRRCRVEAVRDYSVLLDPGSGRPRFLLPRKLVPEEVEVGDHLHVSTRHTPEPSPRPRNAGVGQIFDEALQALEDIDSGWGRPGAPADASAASA